MRQQPRKLIAFHLLAVLFGCRHGATGDPSVSDRQGAAEDLEVTAKRACKAEAGLPLVMTASARFGDGQVKVPLSLTVREDGGVFVADVVGHRVLRVDFDPSAFRIVPLDTGGSDSITAPTLLRWWGKILFVSDDIGLRSFLGDHQTSAVDPFFEIVDLALDDSRDVFAAFSMRGRLEKDPLVVELSPDGRRIDQFGSSVDLGDLTNVASQGYVAVTGKRLVFAFQHRPVVSVFERGTHLRLDVAVKHEIYPALERLDHDKTFTHGKGDGLRLARYLAGTVAGEDGFYVLLDLPYVAIRKYDFKGRLLHTFVWLPPQPITTYFGLGVHPRRGSSITLGVSYSPGIHAVVQLDGLR